MATTTALPYSAAGASAPAGKTGVSFFRAIGKALVDARRRQAERELARHVGFTDKLTDEIERKMTASLSGRSFL